MKLLIFLCFVLIMCEATDWRCAQPVLGPKCRSLIKRWAYYPTENKCKQFVYGGCGGTENNFQTEEECKETCAKKQNVPNFSDVLNSSKESK